MGFKKELYNKNYYETLILGAKEWKEGGIRQEHSKLITTVNIKGARVLDLGCGRGDALRFCLRSGAASVVGVDFSPDAIALSKETLKNEKNWELKCGDALDVLPELREQFDVILMLDSIEHIPAKEIKLILSRLKQLLTDDGTILVNTPFYKRYEDYIKQGKFERPSPVDKNPLTHGMHCTKYTQGRLLDLMMEMGFQCTNMDVALFKKTDYSNHIVCAYYTENTPYEEEINELRASLIKLGVQYYFKPLITLSKWEFNCGMKPAFIKECLLRFSNKTIMYTDADSVLLRHPDYLSTFDSDVAVAHLGKETLSGTIVFKTNKRTLEFIDNWIMEQSLTPNEWDQKVMARVLVKDKDLVVTELPPEYIQIFDHKIQCKTPVVVHNQASRRFKNSVAVTDTMEVKLPDHIKGWRQLSDKSIALLRDNKTSEQYLDDHFCRVTGERRWWPVARASAEIPKHPGVFTIIGKGPSLDRVKKEHLEGTCIALNEAFIPMQKLGCQYGTQLDSWMKDVCYPHQGTLFCSPRAKLHYPGVKEALLLDPRQLGLTATPASLSYAILLAQKMGATKIRLIAFDALQNGNCDYAKVVGYEPTNMGDPKRFLNQKAILAKITVPYEFVQV